MRYYGIDFVDFYRGRLSFRKLLVLTRHLPSESASATAQGGHGFSMTQLLVMEGGISGELNPRHPWRAAQDADTVGRSQALKGRTAYYDTLREAQREARSAAQQDRDASDRQAADADGQEPRRAANEDQEQRD